MRLSSDVAALGDTKAPVSDLGKLIDSPSWTFGGIAPQSGIDAL